MDREEVIKFLEERLEKVRKEEAYAFNTIGAYEYVINDLLSEE